VLKDVWEIELDKTSMFKHFIYMKRKDGSLEGKVALLPSDSDRVFKDIVEKWNKAKKEN